MTINKENLKQLREPIPSAQISWRVGATNLDKTRGQALPYIDNRIVQNRLDDVLGPENWSNRFEEVVVNNQLMAVRCIIGVRIGDEWVEKEDGANLDDSSSSGNAAEMAIKGVYSDAMKRAAVQWGIGRYLYEFEAPWVTLDDRQRLAHIPELPAHLVPAAEAQAKADAAKANGATTAADKPAVKVAAGTQKDTSSKSEAPVASASDVKAEVKSEVKQESKPEPKTETKADAAVKAPSTAAEVLQPPTENAGNADALVDAHVAKTAAPAASVAKASEAAATVPQESVADSGDIPDGLTPEQKALVDDLLAKIEKLPPKMIRSYITGPKGQEKLTEASREFLLKKVAAKEALVD